MTLVEAVRKIITSRTVLFKEMSVGRCKCHTVLVMFMRHINWDNRLYNIWFMWIPLTMRQYCATSFVCLFFFLSIFIVQTIESPAISALIWCYCHVEGQLYVFIRRFSNVLIYIISRYLTYGLVTLRFVCFTAHKIFFAVVNYQALCVNISEKRKHFNDYFALLSDTNKSSHVRYLLIRVSLDS